MVSLTTKSKEFLAKRGFISDVCEKNVHIPDKFRPGKMTMFKRDLFGFADLIAIHVESKTILAVQYTSVSNQSARVEKIKQSEPAKKWLQAGGAITVHGWGKKGPRGGRKLWECTETVIYLYSEKLHSVKLNSVKLSGG